MADINGVELSYATKDEYDFEGGEYDDGEVQTAMEEDYEHPAYDEYKEQRAGFDAFTNKESNMHGKWTKENFEEFHRNNPEIYNLFVKFTNMATQRKKYYSAKAIFHRIRWESMISGEGDYKIDDGWISHYARKFMDDFPQHSGFFQTRDRQNSYHS